MAEQKRQGFWKKQQNKPTAAGGQPNRDTRRHNVTSNLLTLLLSVLIIVGGVLLPTLLYPYLDPYRNETVQLAHPPEETISQHVFDEPVTLYPWNLYAEDRVKPLSNADRSLLESRGVPDFLIAILRDHGMPELLDENGDILDKASQRAQIINSFRYLESQNDIEPGCYVLVDADIDGDGEADLRCAADLGGNIISLLIVSRQWDSLTIEAPIGIPTEPSTEEEADGGEPEGEGTEAETDGTAADEADQEAGEAAAPADDTTNGTAGNATVGTNGDETEGGTGDEAGDGTETQATDPTVDYTPPLQEDEYLWSFIYATAREAKTIEQQELFLAFRQLELTYETRYGYPYTVLLPIQPTEPEVLPEVESESLTPTVFVTGDYLLYIFDLPSGERLILYLDPRTSHCLGFNLLRY
ncbi:MAG: hypothetical protein LBH64_01535 [Coriobacteriales bacterium]|jgi:hypothetical protein|nr:hypothetical protein [Coriobacteriales bacterium]